MNMNRSLARTALFAAVATSLWACAIASAADTSTMLTGAQEVPPVVTTAISRSSNMYINVHSAVPVTGGIRAQLEP